MRKNDSDAPGMDNIKESDDIAHNSSKIIGIRQSPLGLVIEIKKNRNGKVGGKLVYDWDIDTGYFTYMPTYGDAVESNLREFIEFLLPDNVNIPQRQELLPGK